MPGNEISADLEAEFRSTSSALALLPASERFEFRCSPGVPLPPHPAANNIVQTRITTKTARPNLREIFESRLGKLIRAPCRQTFANRGNFIKQTVSLRW